MRRCYLHLSGLRGRGTRCFQPSSSPNPPAQSVHVTALSSSDVALGGGGGLKCLSCNRGNRRVAPIAGETEHTGERRDARGGPPRLLQATPIPYGSNLRRPQRDPNLNRWNRPVGGSPGPPLLPQQDVAGLPRAASDLTARSRISISCFPLMAFFRVAFWPRRRRQLPHGPRVRRLRRRRPLTSPLVHVSAGFSEASGGKCC